MVDFSVAERKSEALHRLLTGFKAAVIGYSGGVDSAFLSVAALRALGSDRVLACMAVGPSLARREREQAEALAVDHGIPLRVYTGSEMENPDYRRNGADRCYHCKADLFLHLRRMAGEIGFSAVLYGANAEDGKDFRPGHRAAAEAGARAPLAEVGLEKAEIRWLAQSWGLACHDKPASPCLSSRIPYGQEVTSANLARVERGEDLLYSLGLREFRLRADGDCARIETLPAEFHRFSDTGWSRALNEKLREFGFRNVVLDLGGLRSGGLNAALSAAEREAALRGDGKNR